MTTEIEFRRKELQDYQNNIDNFNTIISTLPNSLPTRLESYRSRTDKHAAAAEIQDLDDVKLVADVWFHDELQARIRSEIVEMRKVEAILTVLESN